MASSKIVPMEKHRSLTPTRLAVQCGIGELLVAISLLAPLFFPKTFHDGGWPTRAFFLAPPLLFGIVLLTVTTRRLKLGIRDRRWPTSQTDSLRNILNSGLLRSVSILCILAWSLSLLKDGTHYLPMAISCNLLWFTLTCLQYAVRLPDATSGFIQLDLQPPPTH